MIFVFPIEVFVILIILLFLSILVGINYLLDNVSQIILGIVVVTLFVVVCFLLFKLFVKLYEKNKNKAFFIGFIAVSLFWILGPLYFMQFEFLDKSNVYLSIFGENILLRYLVVPMVLGFIVSLGLLLLAYKIKSKSVQSILCIISAVFIVTISLFSANICTKSYSDSIVKEFSNESTTQYVVTKKANIYYPSFKDQEYSLNGNVYSLEDSKSINRFPLLCPIKFSNDSFESGSIVYVKSSSGVYDREFVKVSDGKKAGFVESKLLSKK